MAITAVTMPKLGMTMTEGKVSTWEAPLGAALKVGDPVFDVETSKITNVCEAPGAGILRRQIATAGETLPVGALVAVIADAAAPDSDIDAFIKDFRADAQA